MSLSWIKNASLFRAGTLPKSFFKNLSLRKILTNWQTNFSFASIKDKATLGIIVGRNEIQAIHTSLNKQARQIDWVETCRLECPLFTGTPGAAHEKEVDQFFANINNRLDSKYVHIQVSLPDPVALIGFYPVDSIPGKSEQARELARWRISKQFHAQDKNLLCDYQQVGKLDDKQMLMAIAISADWLGFLQNVMQKNGILASVTDLAINHHFNQLTDQELSEPAALIGLTDDYWSVLIWNEAGQPRFIRARWRRQDINEPAAELSNIAEEIIQTMLVYAHERQESNIAKVLISAREQERTILAEHLQQQMTQPVGIPDIDANQTVINPSLPAMACSVVMPR